MPKEDGRKKPESGQCGKCRLAVGTGENVEAGTSVSTNSLEEMAGGWKIRNLSGRVPDQVAVKLPTKPPAKTPGGNVDGIQDRLPDNVADTTLCATPGCFASASTDERRGEQEIQRADDLAHAAASGSVTSPHLACAADDTVETAPELAADALADDSIAPVARHVAECVRSSDVHMNESRILAHGVAPHSQPAILPAAQTEYAELTRQVSRALADRGVAQALVCHKLSLSTTVFSNWLHM
eukprot:271222-Pleurochrysis_carterae.AAC.1